MSGYANLNAYADPNVLLQTQGGQAVTNIAAQDIANQYAPQRNQLFISGEQQKQGANDIAMVGQAAQGLLALPDEASRAAAYPGVVANLQRDGYAKNAPASYMGEAGLRQIVAQSLPVTQQYNLGLASSPGWDAAVRSLQAPLPGQQGYGGGSGAAAAPTYTPTGTIEPDALTRATAVRDGLIKRGLDPDTATAFAANALHESAANPNVGSGDAGASHGLFQWRDDRAAAYQKNFGHSPDNAPLDEQLDNVVRELSTTEGAARDQIAAAQGPAAKAAAVSQYYLRPKDVVPEMQRRGGTALQLVSQLGGSGQLAGGGQVILGDSYASKDGLGGSGVVGAQPGNARPTDVLSQIQRQATTGALRGKDVVISTGAVNAGGDTSRVAEQIQTAKDAGAKSVTVVGAVDTPQYTQTNQQLEQIAQAHGARFVPVGAAGADGTHPASYAPLRQAVRLGGTAAAGPAALPPPASTAPAMATPTPPAGVPAAGADAGAAETALGLPPRNPILPVAPPSAPPAAGGAPASPAGTPPAPTAPAAPPGQPPPQATGPIRTSADVPAPGQVGGIPTGQASVQYQQAQELMRRALAIEASGLGATPRGKAMADWAKGQAQLILQTDSVVTLPDGTQLHPLSGKIDNAATPRPNFVWDPEHNAFVDKNSAAKPEFAPSPRFGQVPGYGTAMAGGGGQPQFFPVNPEGLATQEAAKAIGAATGKDVAAQVPKYMAMGTTADQALRTIDEGIQHLNDAQKGGIPSGFFAPWLATGAAALKSAGADLTSLGIDPKAVGDVQSAQKTLGIVAGSILQNTIGKDSQITDAKIDHFIHTQPDLAMDPQALQRILGWARTQFQFEHDMSIDAMKAAATSPTGTLPLNWAPQYFTSKGAFGPIYNPITGQSALPTGEGPPREAPAAQPRNQSSSPPAFTEGQTASGPNGAKIVYRGGKWVPL
jgi:hypothetical protein